MPDIKSAFAILATILYLLSTVRYVRAMIQGKTRPHIYTWLVWSLTQGTATVALWVHGEISSALSLTLDTALIVIVCIAALKFGTKDITKGDTMTLIGALLAIVVWWQLNNPLLALIMVSLIDFLGYIPSFRKTFFDPWGENATSFAVFSLATICIILSLETYNFMTLAYISTITSCNVILVILALGRRPFVKK